ncbi:MAG: hypothetical protein DRO23_10375 [Thermoprotei archaeon]|nr:MAG: hypothetical protein DRO23_10375 [Thermoprotei archaeon]
MLREGVTPVVALLLLIMVTIGISVVFYTWISSASTSLTKQGVDSNVRTSLKSEGVEKLPSGGLRIYVRNIGETTVIVDKIYIYDSMRSRLLFTESYYLKLDPRELGYITIPAIKVAQINAEKMKGVKIILSTKTGVSSSYTTLSEIMKLPYKPTLIALRAYRSNIDPSQNHWVVFNYNSGDYRLYEGSEDHPNEPYKGIAPILENIDEYTITNTWVPWSQRPVDSPIIIVINPKYGQEDWVFTWHDPHGTFRFYLQKLLGDIEIDFLVFWEDLFNPFKPPGSVDDWKDHVVRVTVFTNGTYRIAVFMAKGGYSHEFYLNVTKETPLEGIFIYTKPFGAYWFNVIGGYYYEMPDKIYYVTP